MTNATPANSLAEIARSFIETVWNGGDTNALRRFVAPDFVDEAYTPGTVEGHAAMVEMLKTVLPDAHWTIERLTADEHCVVCQLNLTGTHRGEFRGLAPLGNRIAVKAYRSLSFRDGMIVRHAALLDTAALIRQMQERTDSEGRGRPA